MSHHTRCRMTFLRKGKRIKVYRDGDYSHTMSVEDFIKLGNVVKDAARATGPVSTVVTMIVEDERGPL